jgi:hypothetical protein
LFRLLNRFFLALCRVDLLIEQILRIDPKSLSQPRSIPTSTSFSARSVDTNVSQSTTNTVLSRIRQPLPSPSSNSIKQQSYTESISNGKTFGQQTLPIPVLRAQQQTPASRLSVAATQEKAGFKPIEQQSSSIISDTTPRPTPIHPQATQYSGLNFVSKIFNCSILSSNRPNEFSDTDSFSPTII